MNKVSKASVNEIKRLVNHLFDQDRPSENIAKYVIIPTIRYQAKKDLTGLRSYNLDADVPAHPIFLSPERVEELGDLLEEQAMELQDGEELAINTSWVVTYGDCVTRCHKAPIYDGAPGKTYKELTDHTRSCCTVLKTAGGVHLYGIKHGLPNVEDVDTIWGNFLILDKGFIRVTHNYKPEIKALDSSDLDGV